MPLPKTSEPPPRIQIQRVTPQIDCGRHPVKRTEGDRVAVTAIVFRDGHETLAPPSATSRPARRAGSRRRSSRSATTSGRGRSSSTHAGSWSYRIEAWVDRVASFQDELRRKLDAGETDLTGELAEAAAMLGRETLTVEDALALRSEDRFGKSWSQTLEVDVDRPLARFGAWYELFPRSWGGFEGVRAVLPALAELGFDVVYLPPIHPIGSSNRKGKNNALKAGPKDPGSPWAIGSADGGHDAINPELGTLEEFERLVADAKKLGLEIAIDFAIQCSPDHPWLKQHPEWFNRRPDGTLKYAENPPKRYQDIYNVNFDSDDWKGLWAALRDVVLFWVARGVTVFRVDNPHTKPVAFWEWLIDEVRGAASRRDLPRRGIHAARHDADARQERLRAELHVLHVEERALGAARVHGTAARLAGVLPAELLREHAGHPARVPRARWAALRSRRGSCWRRRSRRRTACTPASSGSRTCRCGRARRNTSTRRSTR